jgi:hypothetical protein
VSFFGGKISGGFVLMTKGPGYSFYLSAGEHGMGVSFSL